MARYYKKVDTTLDLQRLNDEAQKEKKRCVGLSRNNVLFTIDESSRRHRSITIDEAATILETTPEEIQKLLDAKGDYEIRDPEPESPVVDPAPEVEKEPEPEEELLEVHEEEAHEEEQEVHEGPVNKPEEKEQPDDPVSTIEHVAQVIALAVAEALAPKFQEILSKFDNLDDAIKLLKETVENFYL